MRQISNGWCDMSHKSLWQQNWLLTNCRAITITTLTIAVFWQMTKILVAIHASVTEVRATQRRSHQRRHESHMTVSAQSRDGIRPRRRSWPIPCGDPAAPRWTELERRPTCTPCSHTRSLQHYAWQKCTRTHTRTIMQLSTAWAAIVQLTTFQSQTRRRWQWQRTVLSLSRQKKIPDFSRRNCRQYVEQMHIY